MFRDSRWSTVALACLVCCSGNSSLLAQVVVDVPAEKAGVRVTLGSDKLEEDGYLIHAELTSQGAAVVQLQLNGHQNEDRSGPLVLLQEEIPGVHSYLVRTNRHPELGETHWQVVAASPAEVIFRTQVRDGALQIEKRFRLEKNSPLIRLEVAFQNLSDEPLDDLAYSLNSGQGLPIENAETSLYGRKFVIATAGEDGETKLATLNDFEAVPGQLPAIRGIPVRYWGSDNQFFASVVINPPRVDSDRRIAAVAPELGMAPDADGVSVGVIADSESFALQPGAEVVHKYLLFNGPKDYPVLDEHAQYGLPTLVDRDNFLFLSVKYISRPVDAVLRFMASLIGDYGLALILTTVLVRVCMLPVTYRQRCNVARIARVNPLLQQLKAQYGKDKDGLAKAQMELYKQHNVNPFGGCLFSLAVTLLFIGAWRGLLDSFLLRHADLLWGITWVENLSVPDRLFPFGQNMMLLGSHFNLFPTVAMILMIAGYSVHAEESAAGDKKKRSFWWPVFFCTLCYTLPSASWLCILTFIVCTKVEERLLPLPEFEDVADDEHAEFDADPSATEPDEAT